MFHWTFRSRARHPLMRLVAAAVGVLALLLLLAFGLLAAAALVIGGGLVLLFNTLRAGRSAARARPAPASSGVIEGEFTVVRDARAPREPAR